MDTGCDVTTVMPKDGNGMGLPYDRLRNAQTAVGVGGPTECCPEAAVLAFYEEGRQIRAYEIDVDVMRPTARQRSYHPCSVGISWIAGA